MATYVEQVDICVPAQLSSYIQVVFEAPLVFEAIMFAALIYRAWDDLKSRGSLGTLPLLRVLYRGTCTQGVVVETYNCLDGILFFVIMTATRIWNIYKVRLSRHMCSADARLVCKKTGVRDTRRPIVSPSSPLRVILYNAVS